MLQLKQTLPFLGKLQLKPISWAVLIAEILDLTTTAGGILFFPQMWEANPLQELLGSWTLMILFKVAATVLVILILERVERWPRSVWVVPLAASLPVLWNVFSILAEVYLWFVI